MADFDANSAFRLGLLNNSGGGAQGGDGLANEKETGEIVVKGLDKLPGTFAKLAESIPILGPILSKLLPLNAGEVSALSGLDTPQGSDIGSKMINPGAGSLSMRGNVLYNSLAAPFMKNSAITDQTGGVGGGASIEASSGGENFLAAASNFSSYVSDMVDYGSGNFSALFNISAPTFDGMPMNMGRGSDMAI